MTTTHALTPTLTIALFALVPLVPATAASTGSPSCDATGELACGSAYGYGSNRGCTDPSWGYKYCTVEWSVQGRGYGLLGGVANSGIRDGSSETGVGSCGYGLDGSCSTDPTTRTLVERVPACAQSYSVDLFVDVTGSFGLGSTRATYTAYAYFPRVC